MVVLSVMIVSGLCGMVIAGSIDSPGAPSAGSGMYSLSQIYDYLNSGIEATPVPGFQEPGTAPGPTMKTTKQIYDDIKAKYKECDAASDDVRQGKKFFSTMSENWGVQTGTLLVLPTPTPTMTPTPTQTPWMFNETSCNAFSGWHWYTTNGRSACWSKTLAEPVSWSKGAGDDSDNPGAYSCASGYTLQQRMEAAAKTTGNGAEWWKIVSSVNGHTMATNGTEDGQSGASYISALAISDCVDGTRDLCTGDGCLCAGQTCSWSRINQTLRGWAGATGKSALPYLATDAGTSQSDNDYWDACVQSGTEDQTLGCSSGNNYFYLNLRACGDSDQNMCWAAACGGPGGQEWNFRVRRLGDTSCSDQYQAVPSFMGDNNATFRVVVRP
ncbi:MAG: hypothetical protein NTZ78_12175 [Candidatus Aureabacteria bacterium]|nr:hypothetical protein [Candidatus Auribacterota bacterium]